MEINFLFLFLFASSVAGSKILVLVPIGFKSHTHVFQPLINGLAERGHDLTVVTPAPSASPLPPNVFEISPISLDSIIDSLGNIFEIRKMGKFGFIATFNPELIASLKRKTYQDPKFREVISKKYDLIIMNGFMNEGMVGVVAKIGAPLILVTTMPAPASLTQYTGNYLPPSFVPVPFWDLTQRMTFTQRLLNYLLNAFFEIGAQIFYRDFYENLYREELSDQNLVPMREIYGNMSLLFMNSHYSLNYPRPNMPDNIEVGGMHCRPAKPLPKDLDDFLSGSGDHGFVYFSLGSIIRTNQMPEEYRKIFVNVFSRLKQRVLWKWEAEKMDDLPPNVKLVKWIPQQDVLGHTKIRVFMTHGGLLSTQEAAYHGAPLLGIPVFADQDLNMMQSESQGFALTLEILNLTETELEGKLKRLLNEPTFAQRAKTLSRIVRDQTETPLERAIYWSEYVIRHKGAHHLRSAARELTYFQALSYDVVGFLFLVLVIAIYVIKSIVIFTIRKICKIFSKKPAKKSVKKLN